MSNDIIDEINGNTSHDIEKIISDDIEVEISAGDVLEIPSDGYRRLLSGKALSLQETYNIMAAEKSVFIALIGPNNCGKTTIETTLYQLFQRKPIKNAHFAGSRTMQGYEERSFYTRINSRGIRSSTPRTSRRVEELFLHLRMYFEDSQEIINYLFADLSGEEIFTHVADVKSLANNMPFIKYADSLTIVLDGDQLVKKEKRNSVIEKAKMMIRTIIDAGLYSSSSKVQIVTSKYDVILEKNDDAIYRFIEERSKEIGSYISQYIPEVTYHKVAAMPTDSRVCVGLGIEELLSAWEYKPRFTNLQEVHYSSHKVISEINKLRYKLSGCDDE